MQIPTYHIFVIQIDVQAKGPSGEALGWQEGVSQRNFVFGFNNLVECERRKVLNMKVEVHCVTEGRIQRFQKEIIFTFIDETHKEFYYMSTR